MSRQLDTESPTELFHRGLAHCIRDGICHPVGLGGQPLAGRELLRVKAQDAQQF
jgi:hypothetical protein